MQTFVFWSNHDSINIYAKNNLNAADRKSLKANGFDRIPFEARADNEEQALEQYFSHFRANTHELASFANTHLFMILLGLGLFIAFLLA